MPFQASDRYKFNAVFFDGHVELLGDLEGANPNFWNPKGTSIGPTAGTQMPNSVLTRYGIDSGKAYIVGE